MNLTVLYIIYTIVAFIFSFLINGLFLRFSKNLGTREYDNQVRWSASSKPSLGGISFFITFLLSIISYSLFIERLPLFNDRQFTGVLIACVAGFLMGLADDAYNTRPILKFSVQVFCAVILIYTGTYINIFQDYLYLNYALTILWVVGIMNSINMLDNMDAITTLTSAVIIVCSILVIIYLKEFTSIHLIVSLGVLASLLGFLYYNFSPSKLFMGDTGSQFLGVFLAAIAIKYFWNLTDDQGIEYPLTKQLIVVLLIFIIPIIDTTTVVINRIARGQSPFIGGKDHTTHHLSYRGLSDKQVAAIFTIISLISLLFIWIMINLLKQWSIMYFFAFCGYILLIFTLLYYNTTITKPNK